MFEVNSYSSYFCFLKSAKISSGFEPNDSIECLEDDFIMSVPNKYEKSSAPVWDIVEGFYANIIFN